MVISAQCIVQDDGTIPVFACVCTPPVFDDGGCTVIVFATIDRNATANLQSKQNS